MELISIGIGLLSLTTAIAGKGISYIRGCDRSMASISLQLNDYIHQSQQDIHAIRTDIAQLQQHIDKLRSLDHDQPHD